MVGKRQKQQESQEPFDQNSQDPVIQRMLGARALVEYKQALH